MDRIKAEHTTRGIKHWGLSGYLSILPRIKFGVTGQESSPQSPTISYRKPLAFIQQNDKSLERIEVNIKGMKSGKNDIKAEIKFEIDELELLQENTWQMAESFGLDGRIANLTGKRKVGFYSWDLDCLECVVSNLQKSPKDKEVADRIASKIEESYRFIKGK